MTRAVLINYASSSRYLNICLQWLHLSGILYFATLEFSSTPIIWKRRASCAHSSEPDDSDSEKRIDRCTAHACNAISFRMQFICINLELSYALSHLALIFLFDMRLNRSRVNAYNGMLLFVIFRINTFILNTHRHEQAPLY